jgi:predicted MPP superfamily phosphohydrolase
MRILHITDFHFSNKSSEVHRQSKVVEKTLESFDQFKVQFDYIFFTGDLVYSGSSVAAFEEANKLLIEGISSKMGIDKSRIFICPGNHDIDRDAVSFATFEHIDNIKNNQQLDSFVVKGNRDYLHSLEPLGNYFSFAKKFYEELNEVNIIENDYSCHIRKDGETSIGIMCLNTAWRAIGKNDTGNLIVPIKFVEEGLRHISHCSVKILLHHHPISDLKAYNKYEIEDLIHNNFNIAFSGHIHKDSASVFFTNTDGILKLEASASLAKNDGSTIGYTIVEVDLDESLTHCVSYYYDQRREFFYEGAARTIPIPVSKEKKEQNKFRRKLRQRYEVELANADDLFLNGKSDKGKGFLDLWTAPVLNKKSSEEVKKNESNINLFSFDNLLSYDQDYIILGKDKCGKLLC